MKLKGLYKLYLVYEEIKDDISYFLKLYESSKAAKMSIDHVMRLLEIANNNLPALEAKYEKLQQNVNHLGSRDLDLSMNLAELKSQIQDAKQRLNSYRLSCQKEAEKALQLHRQNTTLGSLLKQFKNNNEEYIKIQFVARQTVRSALSDKRQLLKIAILSLIESLRADHTKFDVLIHRMPSTIVMPKSTMMYYAGSNSGYHTNPFSYSPNQDGYDEALVEALVNEAAIIYEKMVKDFTNHTITNAAAGGSSNLSSSMTYLDEQVSHAPELFAYRHTTQTSVYDR